MTSGLSLHVLYDAIDHDLNPLRMALASLQPRVINIVGGARKTQAFSFAIEVKQKYPSMRVIFRNWPDDGNHAKDKYKLIYHRDAFGNLIVDDASGCQRWIDDNQSYMLAKLTVLADNESMRDDLDVYGEWHARIMDLAGAKGWSVAVGRFATGNPPKANLSKLSSMFKSLARWGDLHCFSPNEYMSKDASRNGGNINRYVDALDYAKSINAWPFPVNIGEYGLLLMDASGRLDPEAGYKDGRVGIGGRNAARLCIDQWKQWYKPNDIDASLFCWGGDGTAKWERCRIDNDADFLKVLLDAATTGELEPMGTKPLQPNYTADPVTVGNQYRVSTPGTFVNIRNAPMTTADKVGEVDNDAVVTVTDERVAGGEIWRQVVNVNKVSGWLSMQGGNVKMKPYVIPPVIVDTPPVSDPVTPSVPYPEIRATYAKEMAKVYRSLADSYKAMSEDSYNTALQWEKLANVIEDKAA